MFKPSPYLLCSLICFGNLTASSTGYAEEGGDEYQTVVRAKVPDLDERSPRTSAPISLKSDAAMSGLGQALESKTTLDVQETNRGAGSPILRGLIGPQISLVLDGMPLNLSTFRTGPNQYARFVPLMGMEAITITEGPASTLYGQGALGGALHFKSGALESDANYVASVGSESADEAISGSLTLASHLTDDHRLKMRIGAGQWRHGILRTGGGFRALGSDYTEDQIVSQLAYDWTDTLRSEAFYGLVSMNGAGRTDQLGKSDMRRYDTAHHIAFHRLRWTGSAETKLKRASLTFATQFLDDRVRRGSCANDFRSLTPAERRACTNLSKESLSRLRVYEDTTLALRALGDLVFDLGASLEGIVEFSGQRETVHSALEDRRTPDFTAREGVRGQFADGSHVGAASTMALVEHQWKIDGSGRLKTSVGGRLLYQSLFAPELPELGDVRVDAFGWAATFSTDWRSHDGLQAFLAIDRGVRLPNLQESTVLGDTGSKFEVPNPDLGPETGLAYELGVGHEGSNHGISASLGYTDVSDYISEASALYLGRTVFEDKPVVQRVNADQGTVLSATAQGWYSYQQVKASAETRWYRADITNDDQSVPGRRIPPLTYLAELSYAWAESYLSVWVRGAAAQTRLSPIDLKDLRICETGRWSGILDEDCDGTPGWVTLNASYDLELKPSWNLRVQGLNLLDRFYKSHGSGFDAAGRSVIVSLTHRGTLD